MAIGHAVFQTFEIKGSVNSHTFIMKQAIDPAQKSFLVREDIIMTSIIPME